MFVSSGVQLKVGLQICAVRAKEALEIEGKYIIVTNVDVVELPENIHAKRHHPPLGTVPCSCPNVWGHFLEMISAKAQTAD
jgi:hypothetical protein